MYTCKLYFVRVYDIYIIMSVLASYLHTGHFTTDVTYIIVYEYLYVEYMYFSNLLNIDIENYTQTNIMLHGTCMQAFLLHAPS